MSSLLAKHGISAEEERAMWQRQNLIGPLYYADLPLTKKIQMLEDMEEVAKALHGGKLPVSPSQRATDD